MSVSWQFYWLDFRAEGYGPGNGTGHGFAAEDVHIVNDRLKGKTVEVTGTSNATNGADRISSGIAIQTKYCQSAADSVRAAFDKEGLYRYAGQILEVPKDQYADCAPLLRRVRL